MWRKVEDVVLSWRNDLEVWVIGCRPIWVWESLD